MSANAFLSKPVDPQLPYYKLPIVHLIALLSLKNVIDTGVDFEKRNLIRMLRMTVGLQVCECMFRK